MTQERDRRVQFFSHFGSDGAGLPHRARACAGGAARGTTARRAPHAREHIRTRGGPSESSDEATRAQVTRTARRRTVRQDSPRGASPAFGGSAGRMTRPRPRPARGGSVARDAGFARLRCDSTRGASRGGVRGVRADPRRARAAPRRVSGARTRYESLGALPLQAHCRCFFPSPPVQRRRREADAGANARVETSGRIRRRATWRTRRRGTSRPSTSATGATTPSGETRCGKRPHFPIPRAVGHTNGTQNSPSHLRRTESESALNFFPRPAPLPRRCTRRCA